MWLTGERRHRPRINAERIHVSKRVADAEIRLARKLGTTPDALRDYQRADRILGGQR